MDQGPTQDQVERFLSAIPDPVKVRIPAWKAEHPSIFYFPYAGIPFVFRSLTKGEFKQFSQVQVFAPRTAEDWLVETALLFPEIDNVDRQYAGIIDAVAGAIKAMAGFESPDDINQVINLFRSNLGQIEPQVTMLVCTAFRSLKPSDLDEMTLPEIAELVAMAEQILGVPLEIIGTREAALIQKRQEKIAGKRKESGRGAFVHEGRGSTAEKFIAPGGSAEEIAAIAKQKQDERDAEEFMRKHGITGPGPNRFSHASKAIQVAAEEGDPNVLGLEQDVLSALSILKDKQARGEATRANLDYSKMNLPSAEEAIQPLKKEDLIDDDGS